ncbi:MAG: biotin transporter BioY [Oscillospiraceae bacterium]|nr:biotin transporter BioY [Oscillospiraceae bacterium]
MNSAKQKLSARDMAFTGLLAAVIAVLSQVAIPLPSGVPVTLQTFAVALAGFTLGAKLGTASAAVYVIIGAVGVPVFANFKGGLGSLTGPTGGFIWGFILMALLCGLGMDSGKKPLAAVLGAAGLLLCHLCGAAQFTAIKGGGFVHSLLIVSVPYLLKDFISVALAYPLAIVIRNRVHIVKKSKAEA